MGGRLVLDGGMTDSIPLQFMEHEGFNRNVVVRPAEKLPIGHVCHNGQVMTQAYELGHEVALSQMANIENFLDGLR